MKKDLFKKVITWYEENRSKLIGLQMSEVYVQFQMENYELLVPDALKRLGESQKELLVNMSNYGDIVYKKDNNGFEAYSDGELYDRPEPGQINGLFERNLILEVPFDHKSPKGTVTSYQLNPLWKGAILHHLVN